MSLKTMVLPLPVGREIRAARFPFSQRSRTASFASSERDKESFCDEISLCLHICGLRGIQGAAAQQDSFFARLLIGAKDDPLDLLDPVRTKQAQLLPGL